VLERIQQDVTRPGAPFSVSERSIDALALGWSANVNAHDVQASLRRDRNSQFGNATTGALAYAYEFTDVWRAGGAYGTSFTAPSFNQLYFPGFGNPNLKPEEGRHGELFVQWATGVQEWRATAYEHRYDLFISSGPQSGNVPKVKISGATLAWNARLDAWALAASYDHVNPQNDSVGTANFGKQLPRRAKQALKASADWQWATYSIGASMQAYSGRFDDTRNTIRLGGYGVLDLRANWAFLPDWSVGLRLNNVAGKSYETAFGYNQPGREGFVTLRWAPR
jgi:vitamin B12 transporter